MFDLLVNWQTPAFTRPAGPDLLVCILDTLTFFMLGYKLWVSRILSGSVFYRAAWGIIAIGSLWQVLVSGARLITYRLPDWLWSGWILPDVGLFIVVLSTLRRPVLHNPPPPPVEPL